MSLLVRLRKLFFKPEYTGENRCIPCTVVNLAIAMIVSIIAGVVLLPLGLAIFLVSVMLIWSRGYLVPGTPTLTRRYAPQWFLAWFDKDASAGPVETDEPEVPIETRLTQSSVIEPCPDRDDVCLTGDFEEHWWGAIHQVRDGPLGVDELADMLDVERESVELEDLNGAFVMRMDNRKIGQWESQAALVADIAAVRTLSTWVHEWDDLSIDERAQLLGGLRIFIETCPVCDGPVTIEEETVESCCSTREVIASTCDACEARILEAVVP